MLSEKEVLSSRRISSCFIFHYIRMEPARQKGAVFHPTTIWGLEASEIVAGAEFFILNYVATSLDSSFLHKI